MHKKLPIVVVALIFCGLANMPPVAGVLLTGKIAYTSGGILVKDLVTGTTLNTGASGVNPKFSYDGSLIAYNGSGIWVMNANGTNKRLVVPGNGGSPAFSPDGQRLAFTTSSGLSGISVVNLDGSGLTQLTTHGMKAAWSPDGTQIAFASDLNSGDIDIWIMNADGTNPHVALQRAGADIDVVWLYSWKILFGGDMGKRDGYEIFSFDPNVMNSLTRLTNNAGNDFEPSWSPDGTSIAFAALRKPSGIYVMNADGTSLQLIIPRGRQPSWGR
jgi:TolB protein